MGARNENLCNPQDPISQDLGFRWSHGFQSILVSSSVGWISNHQKAVQSQKGEKKLTSIETYYLMKLKNKVVYST